MANNLFQHGARTIALAALSCLTSAFAQTYWNQNSGEAAWRFSVDGKIYRVEVTSNLVQIAPSGGGTLFANIPVKTDKKHGQKIVGQWQAGLFRGFIAIEHVTDERISGYILVPQRGFDPNSCISRTVAVLATLSAANRGRTPCLTVQVSWDRLNNETLKRAVAEEQAQQMAQTYTTAPPQAAETTGQNGLIGTWVSEDAGSVHYTHIEISLRADGTYTKTLQARTPGWGGGGVVGAPSLGGTHSGRWTATGPIVHLSGDGNWPPSDHNLQGFRRVN